MNKAADRAGMRREYVWKKSAADLKCFAGFAVTFICAMCAVMCAIFLVLSVFDWRLIAFDGGFVLGLIVCGTASVYGLRAWADGGVAARSLRYVPPVREQIEALPAEEVLLRGSQISPEELLRAAANQETPADMLLRPASAEERME